MSKSTQQWTRLPQPGCQTLEVGGVPTVRGLGEALDQPGESSLAGAVSSRFHRSYNSRSDGNTIASDVSTKKATASAKIDASSEWTRARNRRRQRLVVFVR